MKAKLINLQVMEAKNVICAWREDVEVDRDFRYFRNGIKRDTAEALYIIPRLIAVGTFDDGTAKAGGLYGYNDINDINYCGLADDDDDEWGGRFRFNNFLHNIDLYEAKAFVRGCVEFGRFGDEDSAKAGILKDMEKAGVKVSEKALEFLSGKEQVPDELLDSKLTDYDLTVRALNCLRYNDINTVRDLVRLKETDVQKFRNCGKKALRELDDFIVDHNLEWGMDV